ncbi:MAG: YHS domain-containing protein [Methanobacteriota archaeon]|nr:MAG: YHS domain-containing protein [Euryarchaeota archaeon]
MGACPCLRGIPSSLLEAFILIRALGSSAGGQLAIDPVCEKPVNPHNAYWMIWYKGTPYYFDTEECQLKFDHKPEHYRLAALERHQKQAVY